ncbi:hypothetical protein ANCCAN_21126 [Ancylostoma caninum]|uniref:Uncharacterized protein n=1 Tax=Ancylostoma caninum TaxID=29170 RepID=A0A368FPW1_ANCCA|nr:hypothetical protein ANCCAN_21126 [Ancylostoma caninum]
MIQHILLMSLICSFIVLTTAQFGYNYGGYNGFGGGYGTESYGELIAPLMITAYRIKMPMSHLCSTRR